MEEDSPKSIRVIGLVIVILSGLTVVSNLMGALVFSYFKLDQIKLDDLGDSGEIVLIRLLFGQYVNICIGTAIMGAFFLIGGLFMRQYKLWANRLLTILSILIIIIVCASVIGMSTLKFDQMDLNLFRLTNVLFIFLSGVPMGLLIWYLNKRDIRKYFN